MVKQYFRNTILILLVTLVAGCAPSAIEPLQALTPSPLRPTFTVEPSDIPLPTSPETSLPTSTYELPTVTLTKTSRPTLTPRPTPNWTLFAKIGGGEIAFVSNRDGDNEIYLMAFPDIEGGPLVEYQLTNNEDDDSVPEWSPDGKKIAFASTRDGNWEIYVMDVQDALQDAESVAPQRLTNHEKDDISPVWSPDGTKIAFSSNRDGDWDIYVMQADGTNIHQLTNSPGIENKPSWSPDGTKIVFDSGEGYNRNIFIMDSDGSNPELVVHAEGGWPTWSPDGTKIAFFGRLASNPDIYVVNVNGTNLTRITQNNLDDWEPSWSPDGEWLLYVSGRATDIFVTRADSSETYRLTQDNFDDWTPVWRPALPEQRSLAISSNTVNQLESLSTLTGHSDRVYALAFATDGSLMASASQDSTIKLWDTASWQEVRTFNQRGDWEVYFAPNDAHIASDDGVILEIMSGIALHALDRRNPHVAFSPDGFWMASSGYDAPIELWDVSIWQIVRKLEGHSDRVFGMAFSPDGKLFASGSGLGPSDVSDFSVKLWEVESGQEMFSLMGHNGDVHAVAFSPDAGLIASASTDATSRVWDSTNGNLVHTFRHGDGLYDVVFSPDGSLLASAGVDRTVKIWDVASGRLLRTLNHADEVMAVVFSPDGTLLASAGYDNKIYLWGIAP